MIKSNLVDPRRLLELFSKIEGDIDKYPALDAPSFRRAVELSVSKTIKK
jgi:hypothetical protein